MHNRYAAWNVVRDHMISGSGYTQRYTGQRQIRHGYYGQAPCDPCGPIAPCDPCTVYSIGGNGPQAWVNYIGRSDKYDSSFHNRNWKLSMDGVQAGTDLVRTRHEQFGVLFGYEGGDLTNTRDRIKGDDTYIGLYAAKVFCNGADIRGVFAYGWQDYDMRRFGNAGHIYTSSFKGNTSEAHLELGKRTSSGGHWSLRPVFAVDVLSSNMKGATEYNSDGGLDAVRYGKTSLTQVFLRTGAEIRGKLDCLTLNGGVFYAYDVNDATLNTRVVSRADSYYASQLVGAKMGRSLLTFNAGATCQINQFFSLMGGYQGECVFDRNDSSVQSTFYAGGAWPW
jgi:outer membrane autotransporter protein